IGARSGEGVHVGPADDLRRGVVQDPVLDLRRRARRDGAAQGHARGRDLVLVVPARDGVEGAHRVAGVVDVEWRRVGGVLVAGLVLLLGPEAVAAVGGGEVAGGDVLRAGAGL